jgi:hypothetical protein
MELTWADSTMPVGLVTALAAAGPTPCDATSFYWPVERSSIDLPAMVRRILMVHRHILAIRITADYYHNPDVKRFPLSRGRARTKRATW